MVALLEGVTIDAASSYEIAKFWAAAMDFVEDPEYPLSPDNEENFVGPRDGNGTGLLFINVPEPKTVKNRIHLDIKVADGDREAEVRRLVELGATIVEDRFRFSDGTGWVVLNDPEGNEFCVVGPPISQAKMEETLQASESE